ncbi:hypothetical protein PTTG_02749 [Puccinia triticina 1-1 BBBD Race 1]|uniref:Chitinase n=1 Tax=Puccinia triticina (isolate 1-1 / race 1 (BBBD)) TaxID=630390 RepID=A0A0C4EPP6_PUCT1|nr:hypothetical protein PTTG_02749 [Puccinia triticina 1-1 BBBD Race 1]
MRSSSLPSFWLPSVLLILLLKATGETQALANTTSCPSKRGGSYASPTPIVSVYYPVRASRTSSLSSPLIPSRLGYNAKFLPVEQIPWKMYNHLQYFVAVPAATPEADLLIDTEENMIQVIKAAKAHGVSISLVGHSTHFPLTITIFPIYQNIHARTHPIRRTFSPYIKRVSADGRVVGLSVTWSETTETGPVLSRRSRVLSRSTASTGSTLESFHSLYITNPNVLIAFPLTVLTLVVVDLTDWEYPNVQGIGCNALNKNDSENFLRFLTLLRAKMGTEFRLSAAVSMKGFMSSDGKNYLKDVSAYAKVVNFFTIMAYDVYVPSLSKVAGPNAPLYSSCSERTQRYSVAQAIKQWKSTGVPAHQILLGMPAYGYGYTLKRSKIVPSHFADTPGLTSQLFQPREMTTPPAGQTAGEATGVDVCGTPNVAGGSWLFKELSETGKLSRNQKQGLGGYQRHYDNCTHTPFLFNPATKNLISYDDSSSLREKASFAQKYGLGGVEIFDATGDTPDSQLLRSVREVFFPKTKYSQHGIRDS